MVRAKGKAEGKRRTRASGQEMIDKREQWVEDRGKDGR
jgi:hypothetical protein